MKLVKTCEACPEQYDAYDDQGNQVGYLRLRHGYFAAYLGSPSGPIVYEAHTKGDGIFEESERDYHLTKAVLALIKNSNAPLYTIEIDK